MTITELETPEDSRHAQSMYATLTLVYNGVLLAEHFMPGPRFFSIMKKFTTLDLMKPSNHPSDAAKE